jgi:NADH-quinone oxidoreductase subunit H
MDGGVPVPAWLDLVVRVLVVIMAAFVIPLIIGQTEHKVMAHMQGRLGPMYAGAYHGWAQLVADGAKFVQKEDIVPRAADRAVFKIAPVLSMIPYMVVLLVIPIGPGGWVAQKLDIGLFFVLAVLGVGVVAVLMAAWASANKFALIGGLRAAAQLLAYELPFVLAAASVAMAAGTLSLSQIVEEWQPWWLLWQLPAMLVFLTAGLAEIRRPPFDMPIADSELVFGFLVEYTGLRFAFFLLAEYVGIVVVSALTVVLFLGGWKLTGTGLDANLGWLWMVMKTGVVAFIILWVRIAYPRLREDQLQRLCWLGLVPLALFQLLLTAGVKLAI